MSIWMNSPSQANGRLGAMNGGSGVLTSWKAIASYMGKGVRTVQRWERDFGLPVRRPSGSDKRAIIALAHDLDTWIAIRCPRVVRELNGDGHVNSLEQRIEASIALRTANRLLINEMRIALSALSCQLSEMSGASGCNGAPRVRN